MSLKEFTIEQLQDEIKRRTDPREQVKDAIQKGLDALPVKYVVTAVWTSQLNPGRFGLRIETQAAIDDRVAKVEAWRERNRQRVEENRKRLMAESLKRRGLCDCHDCVSGAIR
jgi:hypothetical protein